ncbi:LPS export ABC transporter periplasmic protein LptC [Dokdonella sp.]|uniref:LPS export ABC transporter periplasmic protein LptC n=1 Tax=Dokdonella sp. TaxID=2291710 RepID=UPI0025B80926|nr:LPS export ABC transporter periplasmic protein LptC [Dokdonella sp.]MBX3689964.1 LPS export ABC transporter periplasmic protein LptC [Dokdonella sp.]
MRLDRRYWLSVTVLALLALGTQWLVWLNRDRSNAQTFAGPPRSDYTLTDFTLDALDAHGKRNFQVSGPALARRGDGDGSIFVTHPEYAFIDGSDRLWQGKSETAWVDKSGEIMKLLGEVELHQAGATNGGGPTEITASELTAWPRERKIAADTPVTIRRPGSILSGTGMRGDLNDKTLELLADVHFVLQPKSARAKPD